MTPEQIRARAEDLDWMVRTGETTEGAAGRIGISWDGLQRWCQREARTDLWRGLRTNELAQAGYGPADIDALCNGHSGIGRSKKGRAA